MRNNINVNYRFSYKQIIDDDIWNFAIYRFSNNFAINHFYIHRWVFGNTVKIHRVAVCNSCNEFCLFFEPNLPYSIILSKLV